MLLKLFINHLILVESVELNFGPGLNVITGETGAGKSAIIQALRLSLGERADPGLIRKGEEKAIVEAFFEVQGNKELIHFLDESGIDHDENEILCIRREISQSGKNRCFINHQLVQLSLIEKVGVYLVDLVLQHAHHRLFSLDYHLNILDEYSQNQALLDTFRKSWQNQNILESTFKSLLAKKENGNQHLGRYKQEMKEISKLDLETDEEDSLFKEYSDLSKKIEKISKLQEISSSFFEGKSPLLPLINKQKTNIESIAEDDETLQSALELFESILCEMNELSYILSRYQSSVETSPKRLSFIEEKLALITSLKKKFGPSLEAIKNHYKVLENNVFEMESIDQLIEEAQEEFTKIQEETNQLAKVLSEKRLVAAQALGKKIEEELRSLNITKAQFLIDLSRQQRNATGDDKIEFKFAPNVGESWLSIKECASGGELSRVMLAIKTCLAEKEKIPTIIFDEVDANMGGETACIVGEKLKVISQNTQVLCITHLPQVASLATTHFQIKKMENEGRTLSHASQLNQKERQDELKRMLGGKSFDDLAQKVLS